MQPLPKRLVLDTATDYLYGALFEGAHCLVHVYQKGNHNHSETLMPEVERLFKEVNWQVDALNEVIVGIGPGSYTGVRIGVVIAKMLGFCLPIDVWTTSSLALLASGAQKGPVTAFIDARRGMAFAGVYTVDEGQLVCIEKDRYRPRPNFKEDPTPLEQSKPDPRKLFGTPLLKKVEDIHRLEPIYSRQTEAEAQLAKRGRKA